jgi:hypothetical protein
MQIKQIKEEELGLLITGLRAVHIPTLADLQAQLLIQLERELLTRYGKKLQNGKLVGSKATHSSMRWNKPQS